MNKKILWIEDNTRIVNNHLNSFVFDGYFDNKIKKENFIIKNNVTDFLEEFENNKDEIFAVILDWEVFKEPNAKELTDEYSVDMLERIHSINTLSERYIPIAIFTANYEVIINSDTTNSAIKTKNSVLEKSSKFRGGYHPKIKPFDKSEGLIIDVFDWLNSHYKKEKEEEEERQRIKKEKDLKIEKERVDQEEAAAQQIKDDKTAELKEKENKYREKMNKFIQVPKGKQNLNQLFDGLIQKLNNEKSAANDMDVFWQIVELILDDFQFHTASPLFGDEYYKKASAIGRFYYLYNDPTINGAYIEKNEYGNWMNGWVGENSKNMKVSTLIDCNDSIIATLRYFYTVRNKGSHIAGQAMTTGYPHHHKQFEAAYEQLKSVINWYCFQIGEWTKKKFEEEAVVEEEAVEEETNNVAS